MSMKAYSRETRLELKRILNEHVKQMRRQLPWSGESDHVVKKIMKLFR
jgi:hypothetical protein